jgi:hypothetical protein
MQIHLPITALQVQNGEPFGFTYHVQSVINPVQWDAVFFLDIDQFPVVMQKRRSPFFF